jgi:alkylation response protein AidB-like acyl-CoA dehydrogenase
VLRAAGATAWLERIAGGEAASLATTTPDGSWRRATRRHARSRTDGVVLDGTAPFVQDARKAAFFVVSANGPERRRPLRRARDAPGLKIRPTASST